MEPEKRILLWPLIIRPFLSYVTVDLTEQISHEEINNNSNEKTLAAAGLNIFLYM